MILRCLACSLWRQETARRLSGVCKSILLWEQKAESGHEHQPLQPRLVFISCRRCRLQTTGEKALSFFPELSVSLTFLSHWHGSLSPALKLREMLLAQSKPNLFSFAFHFGQEPLIKKRALTHLYSLRVSVFSTVFYRLELCWTRLSVLADFTTGLFPQHVLQLLWVISMVIFDFHADSPYSQTLYLTSVPLKNVSVWLSVIFHAFATLSQRSVIIAGTSAGVVVYNQNTLLHCFMDSADNVVWKNMHLVIKLTVPMAASRLRKTQMEGVCQGKSCKLKWNDRKKFTCNSLWETKCFSRPGRQKFIY